MEAGTPIHLSGIVVSEKRLSGGMSERRAGMGIEFKEVRDVELLILGIS
jgi:hypothetical protein